MIAPVETGLKVHAGNDTTFAGRQETTLRSGLTSSPEGPHREQYAYPHEGASRARGEARRVRVRTSPYREPRGLARGSFRGRRRLLCAVHVRAAAVANRPPHHRPRRVRTPLRPLSVADRTLGHAVAVDLATRLVLPCGGPVLGNRGGVLGQRCRAPARSPGNQPAVRPTHAVRHRRPHEPRGVSAPQTAPLLAGLRHFFHDLRRHADVAGHLFHLRLVEIANREEVHTPVPPFRKVARESLTLVPRAHHDAVLGIRDEIEDCHSRPRPEIPARDGVRLECVEPLLQRGPDRSNPDNPEFNAEGLRPLARVSEIFAAFPVRHRDGQDPPRADRVRTQFRDERRVDPATQPEDDALPAAFPDRMDDERLDDESLLFLEMRSELGHGAGTCVAGINPCGTRSLYRGARVRRAPVNANEATLVWVDEYSRMAEAYDQNVAPRFEPIRHEVVHLADPKPNGRFLDVATGTGLP